jgi:hypothetical protein
LEPIGVTPCNDGATGFRLLPRFASVLEVPITATDWRATTMWGNSGSIKPGDSVTGLGSVHVDLRLSSSASRYDLENLIALSERGCRVLSVLDRPPQPTSRVEVNGEPI